MFRDSKVLLKRYQDMTLFFKVYMKPPKGPETCRFFVSFNFGQIAILRNNFRTSIGKTIILLPITNFAKSTL